MCERDTLQELCKLRHIFHLIIEIFHADTSSYCVCVCVFVCVCVCVCVCVL
jgi:hypothetical protein